jgi:hypothetical protein
MSMLFERSPKKVLSSCSHIFGQRLVGFRDVLSHDNIAGFCDARFRRLPFSRIKKIKYNINRPSGKTIIGGESIVRL